MPYGTARASSLIRKSCTRTASGSPCGRHSRPAFLKSPTSSFFFVSTEITRCCGHSQIDVSELRVAIRTIPTLAGLAVGLQTELLSFQQSPDHGATNPMATCHKLSRQPSQALAGPAQRRHRIAPCAGFDQRHQVAQQVRVTDDQWLARAPPPAHPPLLNTRPPRPVL